MENNSQFFPGMPFFDLSDLIGKTVEIRSITQEGITLLYAFDIKEKITYFLKEYNISE